MVNRLIELSLDASVTIWKLDLRAVANFHVVNPQQALRADVEDWMHENSFFFDAPRDYLLVSSPTVATFWIIQKGLLNQVKSHSQVVVASVGLHGSTKVRQQNMCNSSIVDVRWPFANMHAVEVVPMNLEQAYQKNNRVLRVRMFVNYCVAPAEANRGWIWDWAKQGCLPNVVLRVPDKEESCVVDVDVDIDKNTATIALVTSVEVSQPIWGDADYVPFSGSVHATLMHASVVLDSKGQRTWTADVGQSWYLYRSDLYRNAPTAVVQSCKSDTSQVTCAVLAWNTYKHRVHLPGQLLLNMTDPLYNSAADFKFQPHWHAASVAVSAPVECFAKGQCIAKITVRNKEQQESQLQVKLTKSSTGISVQTE
eukprot:NODE_481_length_1885_cov_127.676906_g474_i0.p1 GENE.NODE_481_length_1885_cov_127.676906_g474_i0~~NODE_481_length_1885_cov_127.676906_g474_i0.p1  ORF type:complete len:368 (-),score=67.32 NODE_481_length_1885_cov_127.676906_g474_i0:109-1212(-)